MALNNNNNNNNNNMIINYKFLLAVHGSPQKKCGLLPKQDGYRLKIIIQIIIQIIIIIIIRTTTISGIKNKYLQ